MSRLMIGLKDETMIAGNLYSVTCKFRNPRQVNSRKRETGRLKEKVRWLIKLGSNWEGQG